MLEPKEASVIIAYHKRDNKIIATVLSAKDPIPENTVWLDMLNPLPEEENNLKEQLQLDIPTKEETWKNHVLNRLYTEQGISYMTAAIITKLDTPYPQTSSATFILSHDYLVTIRHISPTSFKDFAVRMQRSPHKFTTGAEVLEGLLEEMITRVAHNSEVVVEQLDQISHTVFDADSFEKCKKSPSQMMKDVLRQLGACADLNSKINESLHSIIRMLSFFRDVPGNGPEVNSGISVLMTDAMALTQQTAFLSDKITFQLDATLGMINVEQNMIIKIFSIVAVFFLPPTLVSSIYGMNFAYMPELQWEIGYPIAVVIMMMCAVIPYLYFHKKGWL